MSATGRKLPLTALPMEALIRDRSQHYLSGSITVMSWMGDTMKPCLR